MGTTLTGTKVKDTYKSLVKLTDNSPAGSTGKQLSDGNGNDLGVFVDTDGVLGIGAAAVLSLDISSKTDAIRLPNGTTGERVTASAGQLRYNTTANHIEGYVAGSVNDWIDLGQTATGGDLTAIVAGDGLSGTSLDGPIPTLNVSVDDATIETNADALRVKDGGITAVKLATGAISSTAIADDAILTAAINANAVTAAKLSLFDDATVATDTHILVADGTDFINKIVGGDVTIANTGAITIASDAVSYDKIQDTATANRLLGAVTAGTIGEVQVATAMIADNQITNALMADDAIDSAEIADGAIDTVHIAADNITFATIENRYTELVSLGSGTAFALNFLNGTTFTAAASGAATFTFSNAVQGQTIDLIVSGPHALTFAESGGTFNKIGSTNYDSTTNNIIQITCADDASGATIYYYTVATYAPAQPQ